MQTFTNIYGVWNNKILKSQQTADLNRARLKQMTTHKSAGFKCLTGGEEKNAVFEYQIFIGS